jgi:hypothetical protein
MTEVQAPPPVATPAPPVAALAAPPVQNEAKRSVADVVPNNASKPVDPLEIAQTQQALLLAEKERNKTLAERLERLEKMTNEREQQDKLKRKREEDDAEERAKADFENKRSKFIATARTKFEEIERNGAGALDKAHIQTVREQLIGSAQKARSDADLSMVGEQFGPLLALTHAASESAKSQREENAQREFRRIQGNLTQMLAESTPTSVAVSGGMAVDYTATSVVGQTTAPDTGAVRASRFNIFGDPAGDSIAAGRAAMPVRSTVSEVVPERAAAAAPPAAKKEIDLAAPDAMDKVADEYIALTGQFPGEAVFRSGGVQKVVTVVASADGAQRQQIDYKPRRQLYTGQMHMGIMDPLGLKQIVDGINEAKRPGGKRPDDVSAAFRLGELTDTGKPKHMEPYRGPIAEDRLQSQHIF